MDGRFDELLMTVAAQSGGVEGLLKNFFGFLNRRTDFYALIPDDVKEPKMGFRPGAAETLLVKCFRSFPYRDFEGNMVTDPKVIYPHLRKANNPLAPPKVKKDAKAESTEKKNGTEANGTGVGASARAEAKDPPKESPKQTEEDTKEEAPEAPEEPKASLPPKPKPTKREPLPVLETNEKGKQIPLGNGGVGKNYHWQQSLHELTVYLQFPEGTQMSDISCQIRSTKMKVGLKGQEPLLAGIYPEKFRVKPSESFWSFEAETAVLTISLDKTQETWWDSVIEGEPEIDSQQVDSTRAVEDYDEETQATIRKIMFDQDQKRKGLPTSDEIKKYEILEKCKNLPGSPFLMENNNQNVPRPLPEDDLE